MALKVATASSPSARPIRSSDSVVISAVRPATCTRARLERRTTDVIRPRTWLSVESAATARAIVISDGCTTTPTAPASRSLE